MIKSLVMGIKAFIQRRTCPKCTNGILLPYAWKTCELHDPLHRKNIKPAISEIKSFMYSDLYFKVNKEKALQSDMLVYDENLHVIGYKEPIKIREQLV